MRSKSKFHRRKLLAILNIFKNSAQKYQWVMPMKNFANFLIVWCYFVGELTFASHNKYHIILRIFYAIFETKFIRSTLWIMTSQKSQLKILQPILAISATLYTSSSFWNFIPTSVFLCFLCLPFSFLYFS